MLSASGYNYVDHSLCRI